MKTKLLQAKHWQLFIVTFVIPVLLQCVLMVVMFISAIQNPGSNPALQLGSVKIIQLVMIVFYGFFYTWIWSVAIGLQKKVPATVSMKVKKFKFLFFMPLSYFTLFILLYSLVLSNALYSAMSTQFGMIMLLLAGIFVVHLFMMACILYTYYFAAKTIKTVELQREVKFADFAAEFFLILFFPIGVWFIQPRLNAIMQE